MPLPRLNGRKLAKSIPLARLEGLQKHTLAGGTSPGTFTMEEPPPPPRGKHYWPPTHMKTHMITTREKYSLTVFLSRFSTRRIFPRAAERLLYLHCLFLTMVTSSRSATRVFESRIDFNFSAASYGANQSKSLESSDT